MPYSKMRAEVQELLRRLGYRMVPYEYTLPYRRVAALRARGVELLVDVGAGRGIWASEVRRAGYMGDILSLEPLTAPYSQLERRAHRDARWRCKRVAVGAEQGVLTMNVSRETGWSSALPLVEITVRAAPEAQYVGAETVPVATLDEIVESDTARDARLAVKVDVQGFEFSVLQGATRSLARADVFEIEVSVEQVYEGQWLWR